jgi:hypothetical protein
MMLLLALNPGAEFVVIGAVLVIGSLILLTASISTDERMRRREAQRKPPEGEKNDAKPR